LYTSPNIIQVIKSRNRWAGHVACMEEMRNACSIFVEKLEGKNHLKDLVVRGKIILEWFLGK
jgi:hypothetical protein